MFVDSHSHLYAEEFLPDREEMIQRAINEGVEKIILPNIDQSTIQAMFDLTDSHPDLFVPLIGLHPTSVKEDYKLELQVVEQWLAKRSFCAIGEIGIDLYWDKTFLREQIDAFKIQLNWAKDLNIPIVIHTRNSFEEVFEVLEKEKGESLTGVFHCFSGNLEQAHQVIDLGFKIGIGGVVTFKNSGLDAVVQQIDLQHILLETDSPYLAPVPHRGKRNETAYLSIIANKIAELHQIAVEEVGRITTQNSKKLFNL
jgi:TatD DNase family protein